MTPRPEAAHGADGVIPDGVWLNPDQGAAVSGPIWLAARAYATESWDPPIAWVWFTVSWPGRAGPWLVACRLSAPSEGDTYACAWDPVAADAPAGELQIRFDVYDQALRPNVNKAPHGTRTILFQPPDG